jgi:hypothetical protein
MGVKKLPVSVLIVACFFSSPNCGVLFASSSIGITGGAFYKQAPHNLETAKHPDHKITELGQKLKKPRLLKRALFTLDSQDAIVFSLLIFCLVLLFPFVAIFRKPSQLLLRSPPQL